MIFIGMLSDYLHGPAGSGRFSWQWFSPQHLVRQCQRIPVYVKLLCHVMLAKVLKTIVLSSPPQPHPTPPAIEGIVDSESFFCRPT